MLAYRGTSGAGAALLLLCCCFASYASGAELLDKLRDDSELSQVSQDKNKKQLSKYLNPNTAVAGLAGP